MGKEHEISAQAVELQATDGVAFIEQANPLTRLHYFDGKFLRADALSLEQDYHRKRTQLANLAGGWGVVHGLGIALSDNQLVVGAGLAITAAGNFVLATGDMRAKLEDLLKAAPSSPAGGSAAFAGCLEAPRSSVQETAAIAIYEITAGPIEGLFGNEAVYGKLCESACASDSRQPYWREGVVLRLRPITLPLPDSMSVPPAPVHLRNRIASAYFQAEAQRWPVLVSGTGLASGVWCGPAGLYGRDEVVLGLLAREGEVNRVIDAWSGRRERIDTQPRGYWQGRMAMRPWNVFIAQILQFQCQLSGLLQLGGSIAPLDNSGQLRELLGKTRRELKELIERYSRSTKVIVDKITGRPTTQEMKTLSHGVTASYDEMNALSSQLAEVEIDQEAVPRQRMLIHAGFLDLPPAGYLPVVPGDPALEEQMQRMLGEGVHLQYHAVREDEIAHLLEQAQHLQRISLTRGLDNPSSLEEVEIFVPNGRVVDAKATHPGMWWQVSMLGNALPAIYPNSTESTAAAPEEEPEPAAPATPREAQPRLRATADIEWTYHGLARTEARMDGSYGFTLISAGDESSPRPGEDAIRFLWYFEADIATDPFDLAVGGVTSASIELRQTSLQPFAHIILSRGEGQLTVMSQLSGDDGWTQRQVEISLNIKRSIDGRQNYTRITRTVLLRRKNDGANGELIVESRDQLQPLGPVFFVWSNPPHTAGMLVEAADGTSTLIHGMITALSGAPADDLATAAPAPVPRPLQGPQTQLLAMDILPGMPEPASELGAEALSGLMAFAEASNDLAFLGRARHRLFPGIDAAPTPAVRALLDWVMFRRARTHLCGPACAPDLARSVEAVQVWHVRTSDADQRNRLKDALDSGDDEALKAFTFQPVCILRYRNESGYAEEGGERVRSFWRPARPGAAVALGRAWSNPPAERLAWQNQLRLSNMLGQIAELTTPPAAGSGALQTLPGPPRALADHALDGGMLVVTFTIILHRVLLMPGSLYHQALDFFNHDNEPDWQKVEDLVRNNPGEIRDLYLPFEDNLLSEADADVLRQADIEMRPPVAEWMTEAFLVKARSLAEGTDAGAQHEKVVALVQGDATRHTFDTRDSRLGDGTHLASIVGYSNPLI